MLLLACPVKYTKYERSEFHWGILQLEACICIFVFVGVIVIVIERADFRFQEKHKSRCWLSGFRKRDDDYEHEKRVAKQFQDSSCRWKAKGYSDFCVLSGSAAPQCGKLFTHLPFNLCNELITK